MIVDATPGVPPFIATENCPPMILFRPEDHPNAHGEGSPVLKAGRSYHIVLYPCAEMTLRVSNPWAYFTRSFEVLASMPAENEMAGSLYSTGCTRPFPMASPYPWATRAVDCRSTVVAVLFICKGSMIVWLTTSRKGRPVAFAMTEPSSR